MRVSDMPIAEVCEAVGVSRATLIPRLRRSAREAFVLDPLGSAEKPLVEPVCGCEGRLTDLKCVSDYAARGQRRKLWRTLLGECGEADLVVLGSKGGADGDCLVSQPQLHRRLRGEVHCSLGVGERQRAVGGDLFGQRPRLFHEGASRHDLAHETYIESVLGAYPPTRQDQLLRLRHSDQARQPLRSARARHYTDAHFGEREPRSLGGDAEVARQSDLKTPAESQAVEGGDRGHLQAGETFGEGAQSPVVGPSAVGVHLGALLQVYPRAEGLVSRAAEYHGSNPPGALDRFECLARSEEHTS